MKGFVCVWRRGGTENYQWLRSQVWLEKEECRRVAQEIERMGYRVYVVDAKTSYSVGLPETYDP